MNEILGAVAVEWYGDDRDVSIARHGDTLVVVRHNPHGDGRDITRRFAADDGARARAYWVKWGQWAQDYREYQ